MQFNLKGDFLWKFPDLNRHTNILYHQFEKFQNSRMLLNSTINFDEFNNIVEFDNSFSSCFLFFTLLSQKPIIQLSLHVCKLSVLEVCNYQTIFPVKFTLFCTAQLIISNTTCFGVLSI